MRIWKFGFAASCLALSALGSPLFTVPAGIESTSGASVNLGMVFTPNIDIIVDALGFYGTTGNGDEIVGLYDSSGDLLASATVTFTTAGEYLYQSITPVMLTAGNQYTIDEYSSDGFWSYGDLPTTDPNISYDFHDFVYSDTLQFPTDTTAAGGQAYYGPNLDFSVVAPEPTSLFLLGTGLAAIAFRAKRCKRRG